MARHKGAVHVVTTKREYKGKTYVAHLLRRSYREGGKVCNETVGNLSHLPDHIVDLIRKSLRGERLVGVSESFDVVGSPQHGNVAAVLAMMRGLGMSDLLSSRPCRERDLAMAMIAARVLNPMSKLATTRWWHNTTLPKQLGVEDASEDDLYAAMDWLGVDFFLARIRKMAAESFVHSKCNLRMYLPAATRRSPQPSSVKAWRPSWSSSGNRSVRWSIRSALRASRRLSS